MIRTRSTRNRNRLLWIGGALLVIIVLFLALVVFGVQALFIDNEVNEEFVATPAVEKPVAGQGEKAGAGPVASPGPGGPVQVSSGQFHPVLHAGTGEAIVYRQEDGSYVLRLENLDVENGPDLYVYAVAAEDANDADTVLNAGFLNLGQLKGNQGDQTYDLPADFDPGVYRSVSVWCQRFSANFATAPLG